MMINKLCKRAIGVLFSIQFSVVLMTLIALLLAIATFVEHRFSTQTAQTYFYHQPLFFLLLGVAMVNMVGAIVSGGYLRKVKSGMLIFHFAFLFVLTGAWVTHVWGYEGVLHLRTGEQSDRMIERVRGGVDEELRIRTLPFSVKLDRFRLDRYPGSHSPSSYESDLVIYTKQYQRDETLSVNRVIYEQGFRLYQSSYDPDEHGTVITVNYDPYGTAVSYIGYLLFAVGIVVILVGKGSRFRRLLSELNRISDRKTTLLIVFSFGLSVYSQAAIEPKEASRYAPSVSLSESFGRLLVQSPSGRIQPLNSYSEQLLRKFARSDRFSGLNSDQVLLGILLYPDYWARIPFLNQTNSQIHALLGTSGKSIAYDSLFDDQGNYKLEEAVESAYAKESKLRNVFDKELLKLDEKANLFYAIRQGEYLRLFPLPNDDSHRWFSPGDDLSLFSGRDSLFVSRIFGWLLQEMHEIPQTGNEKSAQEVLAMIDTYQQKQAGETLISSEKIDWEIRYNRWQIFDRMSMIYLALSLLMLVIGTLQLIRPGRPIRYLSNIIVVLIALAWAVHTFGLALRWYCSGQALGSNAYETMILLSWASVLGGLIFVGRSAYVGGLSALLGGFVLLVAHLNFMDPEITPLVPVLKSGWLMAHVASIMSSYGLFGLSFLVGLLSLILIVCNRNGNLSVQIRRLRIINELSVTIGLCLLTVGTFLGAVWANESWGRYWGWDPKETWALITMIIYAVVLHARFVDRLRSDYAFSSMTVLALSTVLMTYFGVNYYLSGLHSYGKTDVPPALHFIYILFVLLILLIVAVGVLRRLKKSDLSKGGL